MCFQSLSTHSSPSPSASPAASYLHIYYLLQGCPNASVILKPTVWYPKLANYIPLALQAVSTPRTCQPWYTRLQWRDQCACGSMAR